VFIELLYGADRNVDTEGDSLPVNSRLWSCLYIADRETDDSAVEISAAEDESIRFTVSSKSPVLEQLAALYLFLYCGFSIAKDEELLTQEEVRSLQEKYAEALSRAATSVWHESSDANPYPNLA
jgi:hypothetical protein